MRRGSLSRRGFLGTSTAGLVAAGLPLWYARESVARIEEANGNAKKFGPNDTIVMATIGTGGMGRGDMRAAMGQDGVKMVAVCDVDKKRLEEGAEAAGDDVDKYTDFRELLERDDLDAVIIGTPDHWHAIPAIAAMKKGLDVYCEKPMTLFLDEGKAMVKVARENDSVFQTGSQQRSDRRFRLACELVRNGRIGKLQTVEARIGDNPRGGPYQEAEVPEELDWDFWLGQTPKITYVPERCHYTFRWFSTYSGGKMTDWGAHHNDTAQWGLGADGTGPVKVNAVGDAWNLLPNSYDMPQHFVASCTYENGAVLHTMSHPKCRYARDIVKHLPDEGNGVLFTGEDGWIFVNRGKILASDQKLIDEPLGEDAERLYESNNHMRDFIDCMRSRQRPICDVEVGHRSVSVCHLENIALNVRRELTWDPEKEQFVDDDDANRLLKREMRKPWTLDI